MAAVTTNNQLLNNENTIAKVMERLSSGLKINHAQDNPAGMAISNGVEKPCLKATNLPLIQTCT